MTSCGWHGWPARSGRANLSRPARLPLVADQVSPAVTLAAMARQVFSLLPAHHPSVGAHRRPERVGSAFSHRLVQSPNKPPVGIDLDSEEAIELPPQTGVGHVSDGRDLHTPV